MDSFGFLLRLSARASSKATFVMMSSHVRWRPWRAPPGRLGTAPQKNRRGGYRVHWFIVCGLKFEVLTGSKEPEGSLLRMCLHRARRKVVTVENIHETLLLASLRSTVQEAEPRGLWARMIGVSERRGVRRGR